MRTGISIRRLGLLAAWAAGALWAIGTSAPGEESPAPAPAPAVAPASAPKTLAKLVVRSTAEGTLRLGQAEQPVAPKQPATFTDVPRGQKLTLEFRPKTGPAETFPLAVPPDAPEGVHLACVPAGQPIAVTGMGVAPTEGINPAAGKEAGDVAAIVDAVRKAAELAVGSLPESGLMTLTEPKKTRLREQFEIAGLQIGSDTAVTDAVTDSDKVILRLPKPIGKCQVIVIQNFLLTDTALLAANDPPAVLLAAVKEGGFALQTKAADGKTCTAEGTFSGLVWVWPKEAFAPGAKGPGGLVQPPGWIAATVGEFSFCVPPDWEEMRSAPGMTIWGLGKGESDMALFGVLSGATAEKILGDQPAGSSFTLKPPLPTVLAGKPATLRTGTAKGGKPAWDSAVTLIALSGAGADGKPRGLWLQATSATYEKYRQTLQTILSTVRIGPPGPASDTK